MTYDIKTYEANDHLWWYALYRDGEPRLVAPAMFKTEEAARAAAEEDVAALTKPTPAFDTSKAYFI